MIPALEQVYVITSSDKITVPSYLDAMPRNTNNCKHISSILSTSLPPSHEWVSVATEVPYCAVVRSPLKQQ